MIAMKTAWSDFDDVDFNRFFFRHICYDQENLDQFPGGWHHQHPVEHPAGTSTHGWWHWRGIMLVPYSVMGYDYKLPYRVIMGYISCDLYTLYLVGGDWNHGISWLSHHIGNFMIPTDEVIFFRGVGSTTNQHFMVNHAYSSFCRLFPHTIALKIGWYTAFSDKPRGYLSVKKHGGCAQFFFTQFCWFY